VAMWEMDFEAMEKKCCVEGLKIINEVYVHKGLHLRIFWNCSEIQIEIDRRWEKTSFTASKIFENLHFLRYAFKV
jgi:hypothetical protein